MANKKYSPKLASGILSMASLINILRAINIMTKSPRNIIPFLSMGFKINDFCTQIFILYVVLSQI